jgi:hypothetical protein
MGKSTFRNEFKDYGINFKIIDKNFENRLYKQLDTIRTKRVSKTGLRIKIVTSRKDSIYLSYLPNASFRYNQKSLKGNDRFFCLVISKIYEKYKKGEYTCEGKKCAEFPQKDNISFFKFMLENYKCNK